VKLSRAISAASGVLFLMGFGVAVWAVRERHRVAAAKAEWMQKDTAARSTLNRVRAAALATVSTIATAESTTRAIQPKPGAQTVRKRLPDWLSILASRPELQAAFEQAYQANRDHKYRTIYARLHLTQDQIDRLDVLAAKSAEDNADLAAATRSQNVLPTEPEIAQQQSEQTGELHRQEQAILGDASYVALQTFENQEPIRDAVGKASDMALYSGAAFTGDQKEQLTQLLAQSSGAFQQEPDSPVEAANLDWSSAIARAQSFLSTSQIASLQSESQFQALWALEKQYFAQQSGSEK
jgi:hypothetical protein